MRDILEALRLDHETIGETVLRIIMMSCAGIVAATTFGMSLGILLIHAAR